jgi:DNA polymerase III delta subunit
MVLFVSFKPDKRTRIYKWLSENVQVKNFDLYKEAQLKSFVREKLQPLTISQEVLEYFLEKV